MSICSFPETVLFNHDRSLALMLLISLPCLAFGHFTAHSSRHSASSLLSLLPTYSSHEHKLRADITASLHVDYFLCLDTQHRAWSKQMLPEYFDYLFIVIIKFIAS